jgi:hypothetical protein
LVAFIRVPCKTPGDASGKPSKGLPREDALHNTNKGHQGRKLLMKRAIDAGVTGLVWWDGLHNSAEGYACIGIALARMIDDATRQ